MAKMYVAYNLFGLGITYTNTKSRFKIFKIEYCSKKI